MAFFALFSLFLIVAPPAHAQNFEFNHSNFQTIPIQHEGRIKPLSTFSRTFLYALSGHESLSSMTAEQWLAEALFDPATAINRPIFRIFKPEILGLSPQDNRYYSFKDIAAALDKKSDILTKLGTADPKTLTQDQTELLHINEMAGAYLQLIRSFSVLLPINITLPDKTKKELGISSDKIFTYMDYLTIQEKVMAKTKTVLKKKNNNKVKYSKDELALIKFSLDMEILRESGESNILFRIMPSSDETQDKLWYAPWQLKNSGTMTTEKKDYMVAWQDMALAYLSKDSEGWSTASKKAKTISHDFEGTKNLSLEVAYNLLHPLSLALLFYTAGFLCCIVFLSSNQNLWRIGGTVFLGLAALLNLVTVVVRSLILSRPPVGTLYESIIFVALLCAAVCLFLEFKKRDGNGLLTGSIGGLLLLFVAESFAHDDTLKMLGAVLNTNFWLATHVLCITAGYAWCIVVSFLSHIWLFKNAFGKDGESLIRPIKILVILSLLFTAVGTILGGIWADQSWGRFWGWDPKENGALLIVLWLVWILHGQISGHINKTNAMMAMAALSIIVSLAWFGVNLLNVGLHSYGFISGVAAGLFTFIGLEILLIGFLRWRIYTRQENPA